jgi:glycosyltransferase involved in cell wall biosynthesis
VGSLIPLKQFDQFIGLVAGLASLYPNIKTIICGEGPERKKLQKLIQDFQLTDRVELAGELSHNNTLVLMRDAKILLHPSSYEGFSTVCAEALYAGAQVVSYCQPMHTHFEHHHIVNTKEEMNKKLRELLDNGNLNHDSVLIWPIEESCKRILSLYK